jgi:hypothetical protein
MCIKSIELLLLKQLTTAIGKTLTAEDFATYMTYHNRKIYRDNYQPNAFCFPVQLSDHDSSGITY